VSVRCVLLQAPLLLDYHHQVSMPSVSAARAIASTDTHSAVHPWCVPSDVPAALIRPGARARRFCRDEALRCDGCAADPGDQRAGAGRWRPRAAGERRVAPHPRTLGTCSLTGWMLSGRCCCACLQLRKGSICCQGCLNQVECNQCIIDSRTNPPGAVSNCKCITGASPDFCPPFATKGYIKSESLLLHVRCDARAAN